MDILDSKITLDQNVEIMAIGAQPEDVEIGVGGILLKMAHRGYVTVICDLSRFEDDTSEGFPESEKAAKILNVSERLNLDLGPLQLNQGLDSSKILARCLYQFRPEILLTPYWEDWNPNAGSTNEIVKKALFLASQKKLEESYKPYTPKAIFYYILNKPVIPQIIVNITSTFEAKLEAIKTYQVRAKAPYTPSSFSLSRSNHLFHVESRARYYGFLINCRFGEGLIVEKPISVEDIYEFINP